MNNVHCFYHSADLDGHCSAAIVRRWCQKTGLSFTPHGVNYGKVKTDHWFQTDRAESLAVIVDFTPESGDGLSSLDILRRISEEYEKIVWIDHHDTAIKAVGANGLDIPGNRMRKTAACVQTWYYFGGESLPYTVELLGRYDIFDRSNILEWEGEILPFQYGMRTRETNPDGTDDKGLWEFVLDPKVTRIFLDSLINEGRAVLGYERKQQKMTAKSAAYDCMFNGMLCCAINARGNSLILDSFARPEHKMRILYSFDRNKWRFHLYDNGHDDVHCGEIAKRYSGGGHKGAAGFETGFDTHPAFHLIPAEKYDEVMAIRARNPCCQG